MTKPTTNRLQPLPPDTPTRLELVGTTLFGGNYKHRLAKALGMGRTKFWKVMSGHGKRADLDGDIIEVLDAEADAATQRGIAIGALRRRFIREREKNDAV